MMAEELTRDIEELQTKGLWRQLRQIESPQSREVVINGKKVLNFCSNNYLGLANDPRLVKAASDAMAQFGLGSGASRLVGGDMPPHQELELALADLKHAPSALAFNSGYAANTGIIPALLGRDDIVFSDKLNHASIVDGVILSRAQLKRYAHRDMQQLSDMLNASSGYKRKLIVSDSVFSMDGDTAPLKEIVNLARRYGAWVMVDEAHAFGVLGGNGGGLAQELGLEDQIDIQMGTLSKAVGCCGAYVCGSRELREYLINHARSFIYTTAMPPSLAAAARKAVEIIGSAEGAVLREKLHSNAQYVRQQLKYGDTQLNSGLPIIPIIVKDADATTAMSARLLELGIFMQAIRPPTVPVGTARLRLTIMATHTKDDLDHLLNAMGRL